MQRSVDGSRRDRLHHGEGAQPVPDLAGTGSGLGQWGPADHRTGTTKSASTDQPNEEGEPVQEEPSNTGRVPTHPVQRRRESAELGGRTTNEPQANQPQTDKPSTGQPSTGEATTGDPTGSRATGRGGRQALGPETFRSGKGKLQGGQVPVPGHGALYPRHKQLL